MMQPQPGDEKCSHRAAGGPELKVLLKREVRADERERGTQLELQNSRQ